MRIINFFSRPKATQYEKKIGLDKLSRKRKKRKHKDNNVASKTSKKHCCDEEMSNYVQCEAFSDHVSAQDKSPSEEMHNHTNADCCVDDKIQTKMCVDKKDTTVSRGFFLLSDEIWNIKSDICPAQYTTWNWKEINFPHMASNDKQLNLPSVSPSLVPKGIPCRASVYIPNDSESRFQEEDLEYSFGFERIRKPKVGVKNWQEYKLQQERNEEEEEELLDSPAAVLWSGEVKPLVRPKHATTSGKMETEQQTSVTNRLCYALN